MDGWCNNFTILFVFPIELFVRTLGVYRYGILQYGTVTVLVQYTAVFHGDGILIF